MNTARPWFFAAAIALAMAAELLKVPLHTAPKAVMLTAGAGAGAGAGAEEFGAKNRSAAFQRMSVWPAMTLMPSMAAAPLPMSTVTPGSVGSSVAPLTV